VSVNAAATSPAAHGYASSVRNGPPAPGTVRETSTIAANSRACSCASWRAWARSTSTTSSFGTEGRSTSARAAASTGPGGTSATWAGAGADCMNRTYVRTLTILACRVPASAIHSIVASALSVTSAELGPALGARRRSAPPANEAGDAPRRPTRQANEAGDAPRRRPTNDIGTSEPGSFATTMIIARRPRRRAPSGPPSARARSAARPMRGHSELLTPPRFLPARVTRRTSRIASGDRRCSGLVGTDHSTRHVPPERPRRIGRRGHWRRAPSCSPPR
jgi:hypothetical protein